MIVHLFPRTLLFEKTVNIGVCTALCQGKCSLYLRARILKSFAAAFNLYQESQATHHQLEALNGKDDSELHHEPSPTPSDRRLIASTAMKQWNKRLRNKGK
jgi:hypothetical protein